MDIDNPVLLGLGNPLLDMTIVVPDFELHTRYNLPFDGQLEADENQRKLLDEVAARPDVEFTAGGCALNSSRVFSWMINEKKSVVFVGGVGCDDQATILLDIIAKSGVKTRMNVVPDKPTGKTAALVFGTKRCLCADIGAAAVCPPEHLFPSDSGGVARPVSELANCSFLYVEAYFLTHNFDTAMQAVMYARSNGKTVLFNLCGSYACKLCHKELAEILPLVDVLFGFGEEFKTLNECVNLATLNEVHPDSICRSIFKVIDAMLDDGAPAQLNSDSCPTETVLKDSVPFMSTKLEPIVILTQGPLPVLFVQGNNSVHKVEIEPLPIEYIVDTTGAGDAFVGGFIAAMVQSYDLTQCIEAGMYAARHIIQQKGCTIPLHPADFF